MQESLTAILAQFRALPIGVGVAVGARGGPRLLRVSALYTVCYRADDILDVAAERGPDRQSRCCDQSYD